MIKRLAKRIIGRIGLDVRREPGRLHVQRQRPGVTSLSRGTMQGSLEIIAAQGFHPATVFDIGAGNGTAALYNAFPLARHVLVEPLDEFRAALTSLAASLETADVFIGTVGAEEGHAILNVHPDLFGSSVLKEDEDSDVNGLERTVPQTTMDRLREDNSLAGPYLVKIDTQGAELEVLRGAEAVLAETEVAVLEVSFFQFFAGGPQVADVVAYMRERGLLPYDVVDLMYRPLDLALSQVDMVFVRADSQLRRESVYATKEQRSRQTAELRRHVTR